MSNELQNTSCCGTSTAVETSASSCGCGPDTSSMTDREEVFIILATAMALDNAEAARQALLDAKQIGVTNDEIALVGQVVSTLQGYRAGGALEELNVTQSASSCCR